MNKRTEVIIIGIVVAAVGTGIAYYAYQKSTYDQSEGAFKNLPNNSNLANNTNSITPTTLDNSRNPKCDPLIINNTGNYCVTTNGTEFEPRRDYNSIYGGGVKISLCESFIAQNNKNSTVLRFDGYQQPIIIVRRAGSEVAVPICYTSTFGHELTWRPSVGFPHVSYLFDNDTSRIEFDEHIHTRLDKESFTVPPFDRELLDHDDLPHCGATLPCILPQMMRQK